MLDMNPEIRAQWCKALRSGEYMQAQNALRVRNEDGTYSYCCLGVLTDLYLKAGNPETYQLHHDNDNFHVWEEDTLPTPVKVWAGLDKPNPSLSRIDLEGDLETTSAAEWNDVNGASFQAIADMIDGGQS